jgi:Right handed beta helix region/F5/8 type C domain
VRSAVVLAVLIASLTEVAVDATPARASVEATYYVAPTGSGSACSEASPCSLSSAQSAVENQTSAMTGDIVVQLAGGTYPLTSTWTLGPADGGEQGYNVIYEAAPGATPVINGGTSITGWSETSPGSPVWQAPLPTALDGSSPPQIYVNGVRAVVDSEAAPSVFGTMTGIKSASGVPDGFTFTATGPNSWANVSGTDVVYGAGSIQPWVYAMCPVASISNGTLLEQQDCANSIAAAGWAHNTAWSIENNYALLGNPGQFYVDDAANEIYYVPRPGEDLTSASVIAGLPGTQTLVDVNGTSAGPVTNLQFIGLSFEYSTWQFGTAGVADLQADVLFTPPSGSGPDQNVPLPANVACHACDNITFSGDTFTHLGGSGLSFDGGGSGNTVIGSIFTDISGNGIEVGAGGTYDSTHSPHPPATLESNDTIDDNEVYNVANEYFGGVGILATWVTGTTIDHNNVWDTPYSGISVGWGWGYVTPTGMSNNHIDYNTVHDVMTTALADGGAIYVNGEQDAGGTIDNNYVYNVSRDYAALYLDNGSSNWQVENNVIGGYAPYWLLVQSGSPQANYNTVESNYTATNVGGIVSSGNSTNTVTDNSTGLTSWPAAAQSVIANAGVESAYISTTGSAPQTDLAYGAAATASSSYPGYPASDANNDAAGTPWASANGDPSPSWQVDLGQEYALLDIQLLFRADGSDQPTTRENLAIWVSNNADMSGHTVACEVDAVPLTYEESYNCTPPPGTWRYVAVVKTDTVELVLGQVRVFGAPNYSTNSAPDSDVALNQSVSASSVWPGGYGAANAVDGSTATTFASLENSSDQWLEVSLPQQYALTEAQLVFRQDGYDQPTTRENFAIWVSNNSNMSLGYTVACTVGATPLPYESTYTCPLPPGPWQYVEVMKTDTVELVFAELRVFGH